MVKFNIPDKFLNSEHADFNETLAADAFLAELRTAKKEVNDDIIRYYNIAEDKVSLAKAQALCSIEGITIEDYSTFIEISDKDAEVPIGVPNRTYQDEEENTVVHTWSTWKRANHTFIEVGDKTYLGSNANSGQYPSVDELSGLTIINNKEQAKLTNGRVNSMEPIVEQHTEKLNKIEIKLALYSGAIVLMAWLAQLLFKYYTGS